MKWGETVDVIGVGYRFIVSDEGKYISFIEGDRVIIRTVCYNMPNGYDTIKGIIDSIRTNSNELRIDCSEEHKSKFVTVPFGRILSIEKDNANSGGEEVSDMEQLKADVVSMKTMLESILATISKLKCIQC